MKKGSSKCYEHRDKIEKLIEQGLNQKEIAARLGVTQPTISAGLKLLGISTKRHQAPSEDPPTPTTDPMVGTVYIDENGLKVTRYPARWAEGAFMQAETARSRR